MRKTTIVTFGRIALEAARADVARRSVPGGQVMALEHFVERMAGGFLRLVDQQTIQDAVRAKIGETPMGELQGVRDLPGMTRACADTISRWWMAGLSEAEYGSHPRMKAILALAEAVEDALPADVRKPEDLVAIAADKAKFASKVFGDIVFKGMTDLHPVWRVVLDALVDQGHGFVWDAGPYEVPSWISAYPSSLVTVVTAPKASPSIRAESSADARHETLEAVRWAMELLASGVKGEDIAIATVSMGAYEELMHSVTRGADIHVHMARGVPAMQTVQGQQCAALADVLLRGLSHKRVRRLYEVAAARGPFAELDPAWVDLVPKDASLLSLHRWMTLLGRNDMAQVKPLLEPVLELIAKGPESAVEAGATLLSEDAARLWTRALRSGPVSGLDQTLRAMRVYEAGTALDKVCFMSAGDLVAAPRKHVRLLGLTARAWPRRGGEDRLIPEHVVPASALAPMSVGELDGRDFNSILASTETEVVFSWPRADGDGREQRPSTLVPSETAKSAVYLSRSRKTRLPVSEGDRMFMRSVEFAGTADAERAKAASRNWFRPSVTAHDGQLPPEHPRILAALAQVHSATSLVRMIRDPLGWVWKYALGFDAPEFIDEPVLVDARVKGNILHAILKAAVERLKPKGGFQNVSEKVLRDEISKARASVGVRMEQSQPIPPTLIWVSALDDAERIAVETLLHDFGGGHDTQSWAEVPFGGDLKWLPEDLPWSADLEVVIAGTGGIRVKGSLDRLDLNWSAVTARVLDYKSGRTPDNPEELGINGGKELQRAIYGTVVKTLLPGIEKIESGLYYPMTGTYVPMNDIDGHMEQVADAIRKAKTVLLSGYALPGIGAADQYNDMLFAFPARAINVYLDQKRPLMVSEFTELEKVWEQK